MHYLLRRFRARIRGRWILLGLLLLGLGAAALFFVRGGWGGGSYLELVALDQYGAFAEEISIPAAWTDGADSEWGAVTRFPLLLGIRNLGPDAAQPARLEMSVPVRFRLSSSGRDVLASFHSPGEPLVRYAVTSDLPPAPPGVQPAFIGPDTIWLEPILPSVYCIAAEDSVPEFVAAPPPDLETLSDVLIFYSLHGSELNGRQTGLLRVQLEPDAMRVEAAPEVRVSTATVFQPEIPGPELPGLAYGGHRYAACGEPETPVELFATTWNTLGGGRMIVLSIGGRDRKYLYDITGDGYVDAERWDADGDGRFESMRAVRFPIPSFLIPIVHDPTFDWSLIAELSPDSVARLNPYRNAQLYRPRTSPDDTLPRLDRFGRQRQRPAEEVTPSAAPAPRGPRMLGEPVP